VCAQVIVLLENSLESAQQDAFHASLERFLAQPQYSLLVPLESSQFHLAESGSLVFGYDLLLRANLLLAHLPSSSEKVGATLLRGLYQHFDRYNPNQLLAASDLLRLVLSMGMHADLLAGMLLAETPLDASLAAPSSQPSQQQSDAPKPAQQLSTRSGAFYEKFQTQIDEHVQRNVQILAPVLFIRISTNQVALRMANALLERCTKIAPGDADEVLELLAPYFRSLASWALPTAPAEQREALILLARRAQALDAPYLAQRIGHFPVFRDVFLYNFTKDGSLALKNQLLALLPLMLRLTGEKERGEVRQRLHDLVVYDFPVRSTDLPPTQARYSDYVAALDQLFLALISTRSLVVLEALFPVFREEKHTHADAITRHLNAFVAGLADAEAQSTFDLCCTNFLDESHPDQLRAALINQIALPLLLSESTSVDTVARIYEARLLQLLELLGQGSVRPILGRSLDEKRSLLLRRKCGFSLLEALYRRLPSNVIRERINPVYATGSDVKGNELNSFVLKIAHQAVSEILPPDDLAAEHYRDYKCKAYARMRLFRTDG
jgi:hypothetical protein